MSLNLGMCQTKLKIIKLISILILNNENSFLQKEKCLKLKKLVSIVKIISLK